MPHVMPLRYKSVPPAGRALQGVQPNPLPVSTAALGPPPGLGFAGTPQEQQQAEMGHVSKVPPPGLELPAEDQSEFP